MAKFKVKYTGNFGEYFGWSILWTIVSFLTFGLGFIWQMYWNQKYFFERLEITEDK